MVAPPALGEEGSEFFAALPGNCRVLYQPKPPYVLAPSADPGCRAAGKSRAFAPPPSPERHFERDKTDTVFAPFLPQPPLKRLPLKSGYSPQHPPVQKKLQTQSPQSRRHWLLESLVEEDSVPPTPVGELPLQHPVHAALGSSSVPVPKIRSFTQGAVKLGCREAMSPEGTSVSSGSAVDVAETITRGSCCGRKRGSAAKATADVDDRRTVACVESPVSSVGDEGVPFLLPAAALSPVKHLAVDAGFLFGNSLKPVGDDFIWQDLGRGFRRCSRVSRCEDDSLSRSLPSYALVEEAADDRSPAPSLTPARASTAARAVATPGDSPLAVHPSAKSSPMPPRGRLPLLRLPQGATFGTPVRNASRSRHCAMSPSDCTVSYSGGAGEASFYTARDGTEAAFYTARGEGALFTARGGVTEATSPGERVLSTGTGSTASPLQRVCSANISGTASPVVENSGFMTARSGAATPRTWRETHTFSAVRTWVRKESSQACGAELDICLGDELDCVPPLPLTARSHGASSARSTAASSSDVQK